MPLPGSFGIFPAGDRHGERHVIRLPDGVELRTRRGCCIVGRVLAASRPPAWYPVPPNVKQADVIVDVDWRFWDLQFIPLLRPDARINYHRAGSGPAWIQELLPDQHAIRAEVDPPGRRFVQMHTLWPAHAAFPIAEQLDDMIGQVIDMNFWTIDIFENGMQVSNDWDHRRVGQLIKTERGGFYQCPWLLPADAWQPVLDWQAKKSA